MTTTIETNGTPAPTALSTLREQRQAALTTLDKRINDLVKNAEAFEIKDADDYELTALLVKDMKEAKKDALAFMKPIVADARALWDKMKARENALVKPLDDGIDRGNRALTNWTNAQEAKRKNEEALARSMATQEMRAENETIAKELEAQGDKESAEAMRKQAASSIVPVKAESTVPKVSGIRTYTEYCYRIVDAKLVPREWLMVNEDAIKGYAKNTQGNGTIPGVEFWSEKKVR